MFFGNRAKHPLFQFLAYPQFFLARGQGKSPPRLHKALVEVNRIKAVVTWRPTLPLPTLAASF